MTQRFRSEADARLFVLRGLRSVLEADLVAAGVTPEELAAAEGDLIDLAASLLRGLGEQVDVSTDGSVITITVR